MPKNTWSAAIALFLINAVGGLGYFYFSLPERSEWDDLIRGMVCSIVTALLIINYRRTYGSRVDARS
ncbi:ABC-type nitrate/sulfonate/bicarbonate transport system permease component [Arthrobacter sp. CAN_A2]|uniref:hypothetical protein n=1 Tax=Arthrobacter sp. CAN_A2 TaxID=2787718 RepID=UPI0018EF6625